MLPEGGASGGPAGAPTGGVRSGDVTIGSPSGRVRVHTGNKIIHKAAANPLRALFVLVAAVVAVRQPPNAATYKVEFTASDHAVVYTGGGEKLYELSRS